MSCHRVVYRVTGSRFSPAVGDTKGEASIVVLFDVAEIQMAQYLLDHSAAEPGRRTRILRSLKVLLIIPLVACFNYWPFVIPFADPAGGTWANFQKDPRTAFVVFIYIYVYIYIYIYIYILHVAQMQCCICTHPNLINPCRWDVG